MEQKIFLLKATKITDSSKLWIPFVPELVSLFFSSLHEVNNFASGTASASAFGAALDLMPSSESRVPDSSSAIFPISPINSI